MSTKLLILISALSFGSEILAGNQDSKSVQDANVQSSKKGRLNERYEPYAATTSFQGEGGIPIGVKYVLISPKESKLKSEDYPVNIGSDGMTFAVHVKYSLQYPNADTGGTNNYEHVCLITLKKVLPFDEVKKGSYGQKDILYRNCSMVFDNKIAM